jgi:hypothetical protein
MNYRAPDNSIHDDMDGTALHLLPTGSVLITDEEVEALRPVYTLSVADKLNQLNAEHTLTNRNLCETIMRMAEAFKQVTGGLVDLSTIPGVAKAYAVEAQAAELRSQL